MSTEGKRYINTESGKVHGTQPTGGLCVQALTKCGQAVFGWDKYEETSDPVNCGTCLRCPEQEWTEPIDEFLKRHANA